jgi:hypothetical protein
MVDCDVGLEMENVLDLNMSMRLCNMVVVGDDLGMRDDFGAGSLKV